MNEYVKIPNELKQLNRWVACSVKSKIPMNVLTLKGASSSDASTWSSYGNAFDAVVKFHLFDYLGFVFNGDYVGIDIDKGYTDGLLNELACDIITHCKSYTEKSKSGRGVHIILKGKLPFDGKNNFDGVEIYQSKRFFVMTGHQICYDTIIENREAIDYVLEKYFADTPNPTQKTTNNTIYQPNYKKIEGKKINLTPSFPAIIQGGRNLSLLSYGGSLRKTGYSDDQILTELRKLNKTACKPPLDDREVISVWHSVLKYKRV